MSAKPFGVGKYGHPSPYGGISVWECGASLRSGRAHRSACSGGVSAKPFWVSKYGHPSPYGGISVWECGASLRSGCAHRSACSGGVSAKLWGRQVLSSKPMRWHFSLKQVAWVSELAHESAFACVYVDRIKKQATHRSTCGSV